MWTDNQIANMRERIIEKYGCIPGVGFLVEDCRFEIHAIAKYDPSDPDEIMLDDGANCSLIHCCDPAYPPNIVRGYN